MNNVPWQDRSFAPIPFYPPQSTRPAALSCRFRPAQRPPLICEASPQSPAESLPSVRQVPARLLTAMPHRPCVFLQSHVAYRENRRWQSPRPLSLTATALLRFPGPWIWSQSKRHSNFQFSSAVPCFRQEVPHPSAGQIQTRGYIHKTSAHPAVLRF